MLCVLRTVGLDEEIELCEILGLHSGVGEESCLVGCGCMLTGK